VKLRGRLTTPDGRRGPTISPGPRGAKQITHHGPLQRLLEVLSNTRILRPPENLPDTLPTKYQPDRDGKLHCVI
jgi:hypothetical protein